MENQPTPTITNRFFLILGVLLVVWLIGMGSYYLSQQGVEQNSPLPDDREGPTACTMEAKICPDGSAVGRVGPNCEFAPCPDVLQPEMLR